MTTPERIARVVQTVAQKPVPADLEESLFESGVLDSFALPDMVSGSRKGIWHHGSGFGSASAQIRFAGAHRRLHRHAGFLSDARPRRTSAGLSAGLRIVRAGACGPERGARRAARAAKRAGFSTSPESSNGATPPGRNTGRSGGERRHDCLSRAESHAPKSGWCWCRADSSERRFPGPAAETAARLGMAGIPAIDVPMASAGSLFGMALAARFAPIQRAGSAGRGGENVGCDRARAAGSQYRDSVWRRRGRVPDRSSSGLARKSAHSILHSDGSFAQDLRLEFGEPLHMDGRVVIMQASRKLPAVIREVLDHRQAPGRGDRRVHHASGESESDRSRRESAGSRATESSIQTSPATETRRRRRC